MDFQTIYNECHKAGMDRVMVTAVRPMIVQQHENGMDDNSPVVQEWIVPDGPCGFAWVNIKPATHRFCRWLKENNLARPDSYYKGISIWISEFNQSMTRKEAYANAFSNKLRELLPELKTYAMSRMD